MPELPEVETMVSYLRERAIDGKIQDVRVLRQNGRYLPGSPCIRSQTLHTVARRGKYMTFHLSDGIIVAHNAMSGYWDIKGDEWCFDYVEGARTSKDSDVRVEIDVLCDKVKKTVRFHDSRLFGSLQFYPVRSIEEIPHLKRLGPEPIVTENIDQTIRPNEKSWSILDVVLFSGKHEIKHALMDQISVVGFGNIYAAETLYHAKVDPFKLCKNLSTDEWDRIYTRGRWVLEQALKRKLDYSGLRCYRRSVCLECSSLIVKKDLRGRSTYFCPDCQS